MKEKFLPIGTVVLLKNGTKKIMITGYLPVSKDENKTVYDYSACLFPEGIISVNQTAVFNHEQIAEIIQEGYSNEETTDFMNVLKDYIEKNDPKSAGATTTGNGEVETLDGEGTSNSEATKTEESTPAQTPVVPSTVEPELPKGAVEMPAPSTPIDLPQPAASTETPTTEPPMVEETPVDPSTIGASDGSSPMGVDAIKPFSE